MKDGTILIIETSTTVCSTALCWGDSVLTYKDDHSGDHVRVLSGLIQDNLNSASKRLSELDCIAIAIGPGSYTALRAGLGMAKGLCVSLGIPLISMSSLSGPTSDAIQNDEAFDYYISCMDARRNDIYTSVFDPHMNCVMSPCVINLDTPELDWLKFLENKVCFTGNGANKCNHLSVNNIHKIDQKQQSARYYSRLANTAYNKADFVDLSSIVPEYLKEPNITLAKDKLANTLN
jgi:tRNA threonylcarbamoyladenosine biosynthesis protein TsaB